MSNGTILLITLVLLSPVIFSMLKKFDNGYTPDWNKWKPDFNKFKKSGKIKRPTRSSKVSNTGNKDLKTRLSIWLNECKNARKKREMVDLFLIYGTKPDRLLQEVYKKFGNDPDFPSLNREYLIYRNKERINKILD